MKIAIVHDHLTQVGGAEQVLKILHEMWPDAPIYTLLYDEKKLGGIFPKEKIQTSFLQKLPGAIKHYQWYLPLMPTATESYDLAGFDAVVSSSSAFAKGIITQSDTVHICYCHTPTRYLWSDTHTYIQGLPYPRFVKGALPIILNKLRIWDQVSSQRPDAFVANSGFVSKRIEKYYKRKSSVIYPPVDTKNFFISPSIDKYYLTGGRIVPYKRFDLTIQAFNQLGIPLKIFGDGPQLGYLKKIAKGNIEFLGRVDDSELSKFYSRCMAFIHPQVEDFGITSVEAMASGRPVIAYSGGGARETVEHGITGEFFEEQAWEALADTIVRFKPEKYDSNIIKNHAEKFNVERFKKEIKKCIEQEYARISRI